MTDLVRGSRWWFYGRYVLMLVAALAFAHAGYDSSAHAPNDWVAFEVGARTLTHYHGLPYYGGNPLHLYANDPILQIGPPALLPVVATQWLSPHTVNVLWVVVMTFMGVVSIGFIEAAARRLAPAVDSTIRAVLVFAGGVLIAAAWGYESGRFHHLDDAMALLSIAVAVWLLARGKSVWWVGILLGLAAATKPWAIVAIPLIIALPRIARPKALLAAFITALAFWGPFVISDPQTIHALGTVYIAPRRGSVLWLLNIHGQIQHWLRPVQFGLGIGFAAFVAVRGRWTAVPLAGIAVRVALDPYSYAYYGFGPVLAALLWDLTNTSKRKVPVWTLWTLFIEFGVRLVASPQVSGWGRLVWVLTVLVAFIRAKAITPAAEQLEPQPGTPALATA